MEVEQRAVRAAENGPNLPGAVDLALMVDTYHHVSGRVSYFQSLKKHLKPGGRVAIIDFRMDSPAGPPKHHRVAEERVRSEMKQAGYRLVAEHRFLPDQYFLVFQ